MFFFHGVRSFDATSAKIGYRFLVVGSFPEYTSFPTKKLHFFQCFLCTSIRELGLPPMLFFQLRLLSFSSSLSHNFSTPCHQPWDACSDAHWGNFHPKSRSDLPPRPLRFLSPSLAVRMRKQFTHSFRTELADGPEYPSFRILEFFSAIFHLRVQNSLLFVWAVSSSTMTEPSLHFSTDPPPFFPPPPPPPPVPTQFRSFGVCPEALWVKYLV